MYVFRLLIFGCMASLTTDAAPVTKEDEEDRTERKASVIGDCPLAYIRAVGLRIASYVDLSRGDK